jgi:hypothetical protein
MRMKYTVPEEEPAQIHLTYCRELKYLGPGWPGSAAVIAVSDTKDAFTCEWLAFCASPPVIPRPD